MSIARNFIERVRHDEADWILDAEGHEVFLAQDFNSAIVYAVMDSRTREYGNYLLMPTPWPVRKKVSQAMLDMQDGQELANVGWFPREHLRRLNALPKRHSPVQFLTDLPTRSVISQRAVL